MKRVLFVLIAIFLFTLIGNAQEISKFNQKPVFKSGSIITFFNKEVIEYKFKFFDDLNEGIEEIIRDFNFNAEKERNACEITIEIRIEINIGNNTIVLSEKTRTNCTKEVAAILAKRLKIISIAIAL
jgi:hypothetical protein